MSHISFEDEPLIRNYEIKDSSVYIRNQKIEIFKILTQAGCTIYAIASICATTISGLMKEKDCHINISMALMIEGLVSIFLCGLIIWGSIDKNVRNCSYYTIIGIAFTFSVGVILIGNFLVWPYDKKYHQCENDILFNFSFVYFNLYAILAVICCLINWILSCWLNFRH